MKTATTPLKNFRSKALALAILTTASLTTAGLGTLAVAQETETRAGSGSGIPLASDAPDRYTVKQGDTLWDISKVFLRDPWYWPEIWYVNPQVKNPHLIYPGDVLVLVKGGATPQVTIAERGPEGAAAEAAAEPTPSSGALGTTKLTPQIRSTPISSAVTAISYDTIASFLGRPTMMTASEVKSGPYVVALRDGRVVGGVGDDVYARGVKEATENTRFNIVHVAEPMRDPETDKVLGYRGVYAGMGSVTGPGDPSKLKVHEVDREVLRGDKLFPETVNVELDFMPRAPSKDVRGSVMAVAGNAVHGPHDVVAINRGTKHGLEVGHVLAILKKGEKVRDNFADGTHAGESYKNTGKSVVLPDERIGLMMVFKTYENMSYGLIMEADHHVGNGDIVRTP